MSPPPSKWMMEVVEKQVVQLGALLAKHGNLLSPPWPATVMSPATAGAVPDSR